MPLRPRRQRGVVALISLVLLAVMLVLGLASVRLVRNQERMAGQSYDRALAFQAAEAALREAETLIEQIRPMPGASGCTDFAAAGMTVHACPAPAAGATPRWQAINTADWAAASTVGSGALQLAPQYLVEYLGATFPCSPAPSDPMTCKRYRVTARISGSEGRAAVMVQSVYGTD